MRAKLLAVCTILALGLALFPGPAAALDYTESFVTNCESTGPACDTPYSYGFELTVPETVTVSYTVPETHGVPIAISLRLNGVEQLAMTLGHPGDTTLPLTTGPVDLGVLTAGDYLVEIYASLTTEGPLSSWGGTFTLASEPYTIDVGIAVTPYDIDDLINPMVKPTLPVAILSTAEFAAPTWVDPATLTFGVTGEEDSLSFCSQTPCDVDGDGDLDLMCHFDVADLGLTEEGEVQLILQGQTTIGVPIYGTATVSVSLPEKEWAGSLWQYQWVINNQHKEPGPWQDQEQNSGQAQDNRSAPLPSGGNGNGNGGGGSGSGGSGSGGSGSGK